MKSSPLGSIEPLETRIAPATILIQAGQVGSAIGEVDYDDSNAAEDAIFVNTADDPGDPISALVGPGDSLNPTYYAKLAPTTVLRVFGNAGFQPLISGNVAGTAGTVGTIIAFFVDKNLDNEVQTNELTGLSLGRGVSAIVSGSVDGDVVTNYNASFDRIGGSLEGDGVATDLLLNAISRLVISGDVSGSVVSGGQINNLQVGGKVGQVLAGTAANGYAYDFNTAAVADGGDTISVATPGVRVAGVSIVRTAVGSLTNMQAGDGGPGGVGGSLLGITVLADIDGFTLQGGDGGDGIAGRPTGGNGGAVRSVLINGLDAGQADTSLNDAIVIQAGDGGDAFTSGGRGGTGGALVNIRVGFETIAGQVVPVRSVTAVSDTVRLESGEGGNGRIASAGGIISSVFLFAAPTGADNDIEIFGGDGGATNFASPLSRAGLGASITGVSVLNPDSSLAAHDAKVVIEAGDGGATTQGGIGAAGGSISAVTLVAFSQDLRGGDGSAGTTGGAGGGVIGIRSQEGSDGVRAENVVIDAGAGGVGINGRGGNGGLVRAITVQNGDLELLAINATAGAADGAASKSGVGGRGGSVVAIRISEFDTGVAGAATIRAGNGGAGGDGTPAGGSGGAAGGIANFVSESLVQLDITASGGNGGAATLRGAGGAGGAITDFSFFSSRQTGGTQVNATLNGGVGGVGFLTGAGGAGGNILRANIGLGVAIEGLVGGISTTQVDGGEVAINAGTGGNGGASGGAGLGGTVATARLLTFAGGAAVTAGDAGTGVRPGGGGRIANVVLDVGTTVSLIAGDGHGGGAGGSINRVGYSRAVEDTRLIDEDGVTFIAGLPGSAPLGSVTVQAGDGSGAGRTAGVGGSILDISGFVGLSGNTTFRAGDAGAVPTLARPGGSITDVSLFGGGGAGVEVRIQAGDAADAASTRFGGAGGDVRRVGIGVNTFDTNNLADPDNVFAIDPATIIRHVAAGDGGDTGFATGTGGRGGNVISLNSHHDIGVRSGEGFGFDTMGGIFAGSGGINTNTPGTVSVLGVRAGAAGSVIDVTADSIAAIVAGRPVTDSMITVRNLARVVDQIILNGLQNPTEVNANGTFTNFDTANLVGGIVDPTAMGDAYPAPHSHANTFDLALGEFVDNDGNGEFSLGDQITADTDGFIAAVSFINNLANLRPEAVLTFVSRSAMFIDLNNLNGQAKQA